MSQPLGENVQIPKPCSNCGNECQDYTTYWSPPRFKSFLDGERLVFPRVYICSRCNESPFSGREKLSEVTVSDILGKPLYERENGKWFLVHPPEGSL